MDPIEAEIPPERQARLAVKGKILYAKFCGTGGRGICAESFALHHIRLGEPTVARDLAAFLDARIEALRVGDPDGRLAMTEVLAARIRGHGCANGFRHFRRVGLALPMTHDRQGKPYPTRSGSFAGVAWPVPESAGAPRGHLQGES